MHVRTAALVLAVAAFSSPASAECPRRADAIELANKGDRARATNIDEAIASYEQASHLDPESAPILWKLALTYKKKEDWSHLEAIIARACKIAPDHADYFFLRGYALEKLAAKGAATWADARAALETAVTLDPNYADPEYDLAEVLLRLGDEKGALDHYTKAILKKPDELVFYSALGDLYARLGFLDQAEKTLRAGLAFGSGSAFPLRFLLGDIRTRRKDLAGAIIEFEAAKAACGACNEHGEAIVFFALGGAYARTKPPRKSEAVSLLQTFQKVICRGGAAARYPDECVETNELLKQLGASP